MVAEKSTEPMTRYITSVVPLLKLTCDDACSRYVDLFLEREGSDSMADRLSQQTLLVFLVDDTDILPTLGHQRRDSRDNGLFADSEPIISAGASPGFFTGWSHDRPKVFHCFSTLRMASPDNIILLIVDCHAAGPPWPPCIRRELMFVSMAVLGMPERGEQWKGHVSRWGGAQHDTPPVLEMRYHIPVFLLKYRHGQLHLGIRGGQPRSPSPSLRTAPVCVIIVIIINNQPSTTRCAACNGGRHKLPRPLQVVT